MKYIQIYDTELGPTAIVEEDGAIIKLDLNPMIQEESLMYQETPLLRQAKQELTEYLSGEKREFSVPLRIKGTPFQEKVWRALQAIPYGTTKTYGQIAAEIGSPKGARAVGMACGHNTILIAVPCHRVIGSSGKLVGFAYGIDKKEKLLQLEKDYAIKNL